MSRSSRYVFAFLLFGLSAVASLVVGAPERAPSSAPEALVAAPGQGDKFLGYEIGEERRYVLGPPESLFRGETGTWSIRLEEVYETDAEPEAVFALQHEWQAPEPRTEVALRTIIRVKSEGTVRVNVHGFPLRIRYETVRHLAGMGDEGYTIDYEAVDDHRRYEKRTTKAAKRWYQSVPIRNHDTVDRDVPAGLYVFLPVAPGCMDRHIATYQQQGVVGPQPKSAASPPSAQPAAPTTVKIADNADCEESLFANPGLLSLAMPALWEAQGQRQYVFFTPIGPIGEPTSGVALGLPAGGGIPTGLGGLRPGRIPDPGMPNSMPNSAPRVGGLPLSPSTYHEIEDLEFIERVSVRVGGRTRDAWLIEISNDVGPIYVDDDGGVLRIDLPPMGGSGVRYLRLLWPSEF
jgi:hypothetical protein